MFVYENLGLIIGGVFATGLAAHFNGRRRQRRRYRALRDTYEASLRLVRDTEGDPHAVVRAVELEREFLRVWQPGWFEGFGRRVRVMAKVCAALTLFAYFLKGPIERGEQVAAERARRAARTATAEQRAAGRKDGTSPPSAAVRATGYTPPRAAAKQRRDPGPALHPSPVSFALGSQSTSSRA